MNSGRLTRLRVSFQQRLEVGPRDVHVLLQITAQVPQSVYQRIRVVLVQKLGHLLRRSLCLNVGDALPEGLELLTQLFHDHDLEVEVHLVVATREHVRVRYFGEELSKCVYKHA